MSIAAAMSEDNLEQNKSVPQKSIGVNEYYTNDFEIMSEKSHCNRNGTKFENPYHVINELELKLGKKIKGNHRKVLEFIAKENLSWTFSTIRDLESELKTISFESLKKILSRAVDNGILVIHPEKKGHSNQYVLSNLQDYVVSEKKLKVDAGADDCNKNQIELFTLFFFRIISEFISQNKMMFHHIVFSSELNDDDDYAYLDWYIPSTKNKARKHEFKLSRLRSCVVNIYPNKSVTIAIKCSKDPFDLLSIEGINKLHADCGKILNEIINSTNNPQPLITDIPDWKIVQIDAAYDIPLHEIEPNLSKISEIYGRQDYLISVWPKCLRIKHLNRIYQIYLKILPTHGYSLRIEQRFGFNYLQPTVDEFKDHLCRGKYSENS
jgi:hypothetical protein